ncbi:MAG: transcription antitermination factor NusB [Roseivirga sp.]
MTNKSLRNRRFIRLQAIQHFYAFYIGKQANYDCALDQIRAAFVPDVFAEAPVDKALLDQEMQQALTLFAAYLGATSSTDLSHTSSRIVQAVTEARTSYERELAKDLHRLKRGLAEAEAIMHRSYARIWQLLIEWAYMAQKQHERPKRSQLHATDSLGALAHNRLLQRLQADSAFAQWIQQQAAGWEDNMPLVESWYHQWIKKDPTVQRYCAPPATLAQEDKLLAYLTKQVIFGNKVIQAFFSDVDLNWDVHQGLMKKMIHQSLTLLRQNPEKGLILNPVDVSSYGEAGRQFYTDLVHRTLENEEELEAEITKSTKNWTVDRFMLLDKTIIKLALCEMMYFADIPVKVSINEYIDLSKAYSTPQSGQFVNGLLDAVAATLE